jgi:hypothetical protein
MALSHCCEEVLGAPGREFAGDGDQQYPRQRRDRNLNELRPHSGHEAALPRAPTALTLHLAEA